MMILTLTTTISDDSKSLFSATWSFSCLKHSLNVLRVAHEQRMVVIYSSLLNCLYFTSVLLPSLPRHFFNAPTTRARW